jgi:hypothetical protein
MTIENLDNQEKQELLRKLIEETPVNKIVDTIILTKLSSEVTEIAELLKLNG